MKQLYTLATMRMRAFRNALRYDMQMRVTFSLTLLFSILGGLWATHTLMHQIMVWRADGILTLERQLWLLLPGIWSGIGLLAVLTTIREGFNEQEAMLMFTLPLTSATRLRALAMQLLISGSGIWILLISLVLSLTLGWFALPWLIVGILGTIAIPLCCMVGVLLVMPQKRWVQSVVCALISGTAGIALLAMFMHVVVVFTPALLSSIFILCIVLVIGPGADLLGQCYATAFHLLQARTGPRKAITLPGIPMLCKLLSRSRTMIAAMAVKEVQYQSRNPLNWLRIVAIALYLLPFPWLYVYIAAYSISRTMYIIAYVSIITLVGLIDASPSPIGSEGNRLMLYLVTPVEIKRIIYAKLSVFLAPLLVLACLMTAITGWIFHIAFNELVLALLQVLCITGGGIMLLVLGSAWDEDLHVVVEGTMQMFLYEQLPATPRRIWLINLTSALLALMLLLAWKLSPFEALVAFVLLDSAILYSASAWGTHYLYGLLRKG